MDNEPRKLKRLVIKEELVELCYMALEKIKESILIPTEWQHGYGRIQIREESYHAEEKAFK